MSLISMIDCIIILNNDKLPDVGERTRGMFVLESLNSGISTILIMTISLMKHIKITNILLFKFSIFDELFNSGNIAMMRRNEMFVFIQTLIIIFVFNCIFIADFVVVTSDKNITHIWKAHVIGEYISTFISVITITQFVDFVQLLKQKIITINNNLIKTRFDGDGEEECNQDILFKTYTYYDMKVFQVSAELKNKDNFEEKFKKWCDSHITLNFDDSFKLSQAKNIRALRICQDILCDICCMLNSLYGTQLLIFTIFNFLAMTSNLSYGIISLLTRVENQQTYRFPVYDSFLWAAMIFIIQLYPMASCSETSNESKKTLILIHKFLLKPGVDPEVLTELKLFSQQVNNRTIKFSAMDFFTINYKNLGAMVGASVTVLLMFLQFQHVNNLF
ncbi:hypothetical protein L9F63_009812 [Diploptera punctata]|uniref:Gustatory receptor n=1 Tax=Diploptera punctata TaxID=6984 RepID=A0AAD8AJG1_DIPPU|nr:hypothetical protein L9F63_009812 [Diploptera punctata]